MNNMIKFILALAIALSSGTAYSQNNNGTDTSNAVSSTDSSPKSLSDLVTVRGIPAAEIIPINVASVTDKLIFMGIAPADPTEVRNGATDKVGNLTVHPAIDLIPFEMQQVRDFMSGQGHFTEESNSPRKKGVIILRYGADHPGIPELMSDLKRMRAYSAVFVTDGPSTVDSKKVEFPIVNGKQAATSALITPESLANGKQGKIFQDLLTRGYELKTPINPIQGELIKPGDFYFTMSAAMSNNDGINPIMHEKEMIFYTVKNSARPLTMDNIERIYVSHGTGNWTRTHFNRTFMLRDAGTNEGRTPNRAALEHALNVIKAFATEGATGRINHIQTIGRPRFTFNDGSHIEISYTDGKHDQNLRMASLLNDFAANPDRARVEQVIMSHFVFTNSSVRDALVSSWLVSHEKERPFPIRGVLDEKFVGSRSFGVASTLVGIDVRSPFGRVSKSAPDALAKSIELFVNFEEVPDARNINRDGPPSHRRLTHDKTTVIEWTDLATGQKWADIFTGSFNLSGNKANLERADWIRVPVDSPVAEVIRSSIFKHRDEQRDKGLALPVREATLLLMLAQFVGHSPVDLMKWDKELSRLRHARDRIYTLDIVEKLHRMLKRFNGLVLKDNLKVIDAKTIEPIFKEFAPMLTALSQKPSRLYRPDQVEPEKLQAKIQALKDFMGWYLALPRHQQGFRSTISIQEALELTFGLMENPSSARAAFMKILWRPEMPLHILEGRAFDAYTNLGLEKLLAKPGSGEFAGQSGKFPFSRDRVVTPDFFSRAEQYDLAKLLLENKLEAISDLVMEKTKSVEGLIDRTELVQRLNNLRELAQWYFNLDKKTAPKDLQLTREEFARRLWVDNADLLLKVEIPQEPLRQTFRFLLSSRDVPTRNMDALVDGPMMDLALGRKKFQDFKTAGAVAFAADANPDIPNAAAALRCMSIYR